MIIKTNKNIKLTTLLVLSLVQLSFGQTLNCPNTDPIITSWKISDGVSTMSYYTNINDASPTCNPTIVDSGVEANVQSVSYNQDYVWIQATGCPDYMVGPFNGDGNPSFPDDQARTIALPRNPVPNPGATINDQTRLGDIGYLINGVAIFGAGDNMAYNNQGSWYRNAIFFENDGFGCDRTHPAGTNLHNHQNPTRFDYGAGVQSNVCACFPSAGLYTPNTSQHSPVIGFALDGYPIYGPYAFANTDGSGGISLMSPSYQLRNITTRTTYADGTTAANSGPPVSATYPVGAFLRRL